MTYQHGFGELNSLLREGDVVPITSTKNQAADEPEVLRNGWVLIHFPSQIARLHTFTTLPQPNEMALDFFVDELAVVQSPYGTLRRLHDDAEVFECTSIHDQKCMNEIVDLQMDVLHRWRIELEL